MNGRVLVSVIIPTYNASGSVIRAINSVLNQTVKDLEIVVVDDASTDHTTELVLQCVKKDPRVRLIRQAENGGVSSARNRGIDEAVAPWVAVLDGDDAYLPDRLEKLISLASFYGADIIADNILYYDWNESAITGTAFVQDEHARVIDAPEFLTNCVTGRSAFDYGQLKAVFKKEFMINNKIRYLEELRHGEDFMIYIESLLCGAVFVLSNNPLYIYTQRVGAISRTSSQMSRTLGHLDDMLSHTINLLRHPLVLSSGKIAALVKRRARAIVWFKSWESVYDPLRAHDFLSVIRIALKDWRVIILIFAEVLKRARRINPGRK